MQLSEQILQQTNGGLDIILNYYPNAKEGKNFKLREERTASASIKKLEDGNFVVTDFGFDSVPRNAIMVTAHEEGLTYGEAILHLSAKLGLLNKEHVLKSDIRKKKLAEVDYSFEHGDWYFKTKNFTDEELKILGPLVSEDLCNKYNLFSLEFMAKKTNNEVTEIRATEHYPVFMFENKDKEGKLWQKIYQPKNQDKAYRFFYPNGKPKDFVFGLNIVEKKFNDLQKEADVGSEENTNREEKLERIIIGSGDRDSINIASCGELVIWLNSETEGLSPKLWKDLNKMAHAVILCPDIDQTGKEKAIQNALNYLDLNIAWLPEWLSKAKDFRGHFKKDFTDFIKSFGSNSYTITKNVKRLFDLAMPLKFWNTYLNKDDVKYYIDNVKLYNFLSLSGFNKFEAKGEKEDYLFIKREHHLITKVTPQNVKEYINQFLETKQAELGNHILHGVSNELRNTVYNSSRVSENSLSNLKTVELDFKNYTQASQLLFFSDKIWEISSGAIITKPLDKTSRSVWEDNVVDKKIKRKFGYDLNLKKVSLVDPLFEIKKDENGNYDLDIKNKSCEFLNYLIQTCRIHWKKELEDSFVGLPQNKKEEYFNENKFNISGPNLTEEEIFEQKQHLINKIYAYGYLMHEYKDKSKAWLVYAMENNGMDESESNGRTGKSIYTESIEIWKKSFIKASRNPQMLDDKHFLDGVTEITKYVLFDDADKYFKFRNLFTHITGNFDVNPKNNKPFTIPFKDSPKMAVSSNYTLRDMDSSTLGRVLMVAFSDYYHGKTEQHAEPKSPVDDFNHKLFDDWDCEQWNLYFNFCAQALQFYLSCPIKMQPPENMIHMRNLVSFMGPAFKDWADDYLINQLDDYHSKEDWMKNMKDSSKSLGITTSTSFKKKLNAWAEYRGYILNPKALQNTYDGRIMRKDNGVTKEYLYIQSPDKELTANNDGHFDINEKDDIF
jgi:hypothetical protein